jgi:hypothetical protein
MLWGLRMMLSELRDRTRQGFLDLAWRQWAQAGVAANIAGFDRWVIDPEALILFTIVVARRDPRLFDEVLDWMAVNRKLLSMQRLRNLNRRFPVDPELVGAVITWAEDPSLSAAREPGPAGDHRPEMRQVFSRDVLSFVGEPDPVFAEYGYVRPRVILSRKSRDPDPKIMANFAFLLRHLFGPGSRSEVMRVLLTFPDGPLDAARISDESGFAKRNVNDTLSSLVSSRTVKARRSTNERVFIAYRDKWAKLLEVGPSAASMPVFISWVHLFPAFAEITEWMDRTAETEYSEYMISSSARDLMGRIAPDLEVAGLDIGPKTPSHGTAYLSAFVDTVDTLLGFVGTWSGH